MSKESFSDGTSIAYAYDELGRLISQRTQGGDFLQFVYGGERELPTMLELNGAVTRYEYDAKSRLVSTTTPAGRRSRFGYDEHGRLAAITDGAGRTTRFEYDRTESGQADRSRWRRDDLALRRQRPDVVPARS
ncbi:MAG: hypothetical protein MZV49_05755 [Rhodopseudomonas palustris]|nr:hypothetical protein [Rhodopseudomonas palustris]